MLFGSCAVHHRRVLCQSQVKHHQGDQIWIRLEVFQSWAFETASRTGNTGISMSREACYMSFGRSSMS